jgi:transglutaminase-like putative cysteine protease
MNSPFPPSTGTARSVGFEIDCGLSYMLDGPCDFIFSVHATLGMGQTVLSESILIDPPLAHRVNTDPQSGNRLMRLHADAGPLSLRYRATVARWIEADDVWAREVPIDEVPDDVLHNLMTTRYCESDHLSAVSQKLFGSVPPGYARVAAITEWVRTNIDYRIGASTATTTARDVFVQRAGVCRDFAHLAVTFCRALNIPARLVCGYAHFDEPPPDFHAIFEAYLGGRWVLFDPTGMAPVDKVVRVATGRDAKDVAFATIFGPARMVSMNPDIVEIAPAG